MVVGKPLLLGAPLLALVHCHLLVVEAVGDCRRLLRPVNCSIVAVVFRHLHLLVGVLVLICWCLASAAVILSVVHDLLHICSLIHQIDSGGLRLHYLVLWSVKLRIHHGFIHLGVDSFIEFVLA